MPGGRCLSSSATAAASASLNVVRCNRRRRRGPGSTSIPLLLLLQLLVLALHQTAHALVVVRPPRASPSSPMVRRVHHGAGLPPHVAAAAGAGAAMAGTAAGVEIAEGLRALAERYDVMLIDQWGVMHDGHAPYPGAVECMRELQRLGKHIILLSNSSKRKAGSLVRLKAMGFDPHGYVDCITSGEMTFEGLRDRSAAPYSEVKGTRVLVFGSGEDDRDYVAALGCTLSGVEGADFLLARGPFAILDDPAADAEVQRFGPGRILHESPEFEAIAARAVARGLPLLVSNPDIVRPGGDNDPMPGLLGQAYERKGGRVIYVGKPYQLVYERCRELLDGITGGREATRRLRVCAIGDSMWNDIKGAANEGYGSVFIADGIHAEALGLEQAGGQPVARAALDAFLKGFDYAPTHVVPRFRW